MKQHNGSGELKFAFAVSCGLVCGTIVAFFAVMMGKKYSDYIAESDQWRLSNMTCEEMNYRMMDDRLSYNSFYRAKAEHEKRGC